MKKGKRICCLALVFVMAVCSVGKGTLAEAKKKPTLNKSKATVYVGDKLTLVVQNAKKKKWTSSGKKHLNINLSVSIFFVILSCLFI